MKLKKTKINKNAKGRLHGYQEWYNNGILWFRGIYNNHLVCGYIEQNRVFGNGIGKKGTRVEFHIR